MRSAGKTALAYEVSLCGWKTKPVNEKRLGIDTMLIQRKLRVKGVNRVFLFTICQSFLVVTIREI